LIAEIRIDYITTFSEANTTLIGIFY